MDVNGRKKWAEAREIQASTANNGELYIAFTQPMQTSNVRSRFDQGSIKVRSRFDQGSIQKGRDTMETIFDDKNALTAGNSRIELPSASAAKESVMTAGKKLGERTAYLDPSLSRRALLKGAAIAGIGVAGMGWDDNARASDETHQPEAETGHDYPMPKPHAKTAEQFCRGVIGPAALSAAVSGIAVDKATDTSTRQFANFELREALAVVSILKSLNIPVPPASDAAQTLLQSLKTTPAGTYFDKIYIGAQLANHEFLRDLADFYLGTPFDSADAGETHGRHLAALAITAFKEHVVLAKNIVQALGA